MALTNAQGKLIVTNTDNQLVAFPITQNNLATTGTIIKSQSLVTRGLVSLWRLEESSLTTGGILDTASSTSSTSFASPGNQGTRFGTAPLTDLGILGNAHVFSGDDYITVANSSSLSIASGFSVEMWLYVTTNSNNNRILSHQTGSINGYELILQIDNTINFFLGNSHGSVTTTATLPFNRWVYLSCTQSGSSMKVYFDGVEQTVTGAGASNGDAQTTPMFIGNNASLARAYTGNMDELKFYNVQLTGAEVLQNYQSYFNTIVTNGLVSSWRFDNNYNDTALADTGTGASPANNGTEVGGTYTFSTTSGFTPPSGTNGFTASASADYILLPSNASLHPTTAWTIEMRAINHAGSYKSAIGQYYFELGGAAQGATGIALGTTNGSGGSVAEEELQVRQSTTGSASSIFNTSGSAFPYDTAIYWTVTWDGNDTKIYKNGVFLTTAFTKTGTQNYAVAGGTISGRTSQPDGITGMRSGSKMDFARLYSRALTPAEITQNYVASTQTVATDGLMAWFKFDGNHLDSGPNNVQLKLTGNEIFVPGPNNKGQGMYFDNTSYYTLSSTFTRPQRWTLEGWWKRSTPAGATTFTTAKNTWTGPVGNVPIMRFDYDNFGGGGNSATPSISSVVQIGATETLNMTYWPSGISGRGSFGQSYTDNGSETTAAAAGGEDLTKYHHVVFAYDGTYYKMFMDRVLRLIFTVSVPQGDLFYLSTDFTQVLGAANTAGAGAYNGILSSLKMYNRALTDGSTTTIGNTATGEVAQNYFAEGGGF